MEHLLQKYQNLIYSICYRSTGNPFDAEDLTQEVFLSAYKNLSEFNGQYEKAWLCKIAARKCLDFLKQAGRRSIPTEDTYFRQIPDRLQTPETAVLDLESARQIETLCMTLKSPYKEIALYHFCQELSASEIAEKEHKNIKTVQTQIYRAKAMLKKQLERSG